MSSGCSFKAKLARSGNIFLIVFNKAIIPLAFVGNEMIIASSALRASLAIYLTNRFHFAVRLYSDNAQMTSKRGENKEVRYEPLASSVTDVLTTF